MSKRLSATCARRCGNSFSPSGSFDPGWLAGTACRATKTRAADPPSRVQLFVRRADTDRTAVEQAMEDLPGALALPRTIAAVMSLEHLSRFPKGSSPYRVSISFRIAVVS